MNGVKFDNFHTYDDYGLFINSNEIGTPKAKTSKLDIDGSDGYIDTTNALSDIVFFENRTIKIILTRAYIDTWYTNLKNKIINDLHGKKMKIIFDSDNQYYYFGRISVSNTNVKNNVITVTIECDCEPYKKAINEITKTYSVSGDSSCTITYNGKRVITPTINCTISSGNTLKLVSNGANYELSDGDNIIPDLLFFNGDNTFTLSGNGTAKVIYREEIL